jgi:DNA-binding response OmpR family regulator
MLFFLLIIEQEHVMAEKILIVDDDLETVDFLRLLLNRQGYQTIIAKDGIEALKVVNQELPELIILDVMMPALDGFEVARSLHRRPETALIPILMFTARNQPADKVAGYEAGVDLYLTKPVHPLDLQAHIKALLLQRKARKAALADRGYMVGVLSAKGGQGVSTVAMNLALSYNHQQKVKVIAAELRSGQGTWADELNINVSNGLTHLLRMNATQITQGIVEGQLKASNHGIRILFAGGAHLDAELASGVAQYEAVLQSLGTLAPMIVLDIGTPFLPAFPAVMDMCDEFVVVTEPQILAVRRTAHLIKELRGKGFGSSKALTLVSVNHTRSDSIMNISQIEAIVKHPVALGFPPALELAARSTQIATPIFILQPEALVSLQFSKLAEIIAKHAGK